jgi:hypothetical protein
VHEGTGNAESIAAAAKGQNPVLPVRFHRDGTSLSLFTTIATLGTPREVTLKEIRIEFFFPMDEPTTKAFGCWPK